MAAERPTAPAETAAAAPAIQKQRQPAPETTAAVLAPTLDEMADDAEPTYTHFVHGAQMDALLARVLALADEDGEEDAKAENRLVTAIGGILDYYLPWPGLLDPYLDTIVPPLMALLGTRLAQLADAARTGPPPSAPRLARLGRVLNWVVKVRGWKAVIPYFPSALPHLGVLITLLSPPTASRPGSSSGAQNTLDLPHHPALCGDDAWELRAVLLLWLALLLTVPFSLSALSDAAAPTATHLDIPTHARLFAAPTADLAVRVTLLTLPLLSRPGREGNYAALVLARLFARDDAVQGLAGFLDWAGAELREGEREREANLVASLLYFLALLPGMFSHAYLPVLADFMHGTMVPHLAGGATAASSGLIRKLAIKASGRWWLARLSRGMHDSADPHDALPEGIEEVLDDLMSGLSDKDTIVRYSAAKYLARLAALLPEELSEQIVLATIALFAGTDDEPVVETKYGVVVDPGGSAAGRGAMGLGGVEATRGEARWHGVCLAVAELARRGLLSSDAVADAVPWVVKALTFDLRRASHSVGANVRDAAAYVLWSLSRAASPDQLRPFANSMATALVAVALFDREVGVRRAASAAFQEGVGRLGLYPAGIDVLGKTDFYSVSVRRKAFTVAAPAVAVHPLYRAALREHLHNITLRHWDAAMRTAGGAALAALLRLAPEDMADSVAREVAQIPSLDPTSAHGALVALAELAPLVDDVDKDVLVAALTSVRAAALVTANAPEIIAAGCALAGAALTPTSALVPTARFFDAATRRREAPVHDALAATYRRISEVRPADAQTYISRAVSELNSARAAQRQAGALCLGHFVYRDSAQAAPALTALLRLLDPAAKADVETRRNAVRSLADLACGRAVDGSGFVLAAADYHRVLPALTAGLDDYTTDQRGDVGSWIRLAAIDSLSRILADVAGEPQPLELVPQATFAAVTAGIAKQAVEKLDAVRDGATRAWHLLLAARADDAWAWPAARALEPVGGGVDADADPDLAALWFTAGLQLLDTPARATVVAGLVQSTGSAVRASSERALAPLIAYLGKSSPEHTVVVLGDIVALLAANLSANRVAVPSLTTLARLLPDVRLPATLTPEATAVLARALALATRGVATLKSIDRLGAAMRVVVALLALPGPLDSGLRPKAADALAAFLGHRFPRVRAMTAEDVYLWLAERESGDDDDDAGAELEEMLLETAWAEEEGPARVGDAVALLRQLVVR